MKQLSNEWFTARKNRITGSVAGAILGLSPFMNPDDAMRSMVRSALGAESEFKGNIATEYGKKFESEAIKDFELEHGLTVKDTGFHPYSDWLGASPDGLILEKNAVIEVKCPFGLRNDEDPVFKSAQDQPHYYAQMQIEMFCTDTDICYFYQWSPYGSKLEVINRDDEYLKGAMKQLSAFYARFLIELESPQKHLDPIRKNINESDALVEKYKHAKSEMESYKKLMDSAKTELCKIAEDSGSDKVTIGDLNITKVKKSGAISYSKVVKDLLPDADLSKYKGKDSEYWMVK